MSADLSAHPFYRTKLCAHVLGGRTCPRGLTCVFAHCDADLRAPPRTRCPALLHASRERRVCRNYARHGFCVYGANCAYAHWTPADPALPRAATARKRLDFFASLAA